MASSERLLAEMGAAVKVMRGGLATLMIASGSK